jgi:hypothetical protein
MATVTGVGNPTAGTFVARRHSYAGFYQCLRAGGVPCSEALEVWSIWGQSRFARADTALSECAWRRRGWGARIVTSPGAVRRERERLGGDGPSGPERADVAPRSC